MVQLKEKDVVIISCGYYAGCGIIVLITFKEVIGIRM